MADVKVGPLKAVKQPDGSFALTQYHEGPYSHSPLAEHVVLIVSAEDMASIIATAQA